jgi:oligosaccharide repeat unit polymerase
MNKFRIQLLGLFLFLSTIISIENLIIGWLDCTSIVIAIIFLEIYILIESIFWLKFKTSTYINAPSLILIAMYFWHFPFVTFFYTIPIGIFSDDGGILIYGESELIKAIYYCALCLNLYVYGLFYSSKKIRGHLQKEVYPVSNTIKKFGIFITLLSISLVVIFQYTDNRYLNSTGYLDLYLNQTDSIISRIYYSMQFFIPFFLLMSFGEGRNKFDFLKVTALFLILVILSLFNGDRSLLFSLIVAYVVGFDSFIKRLSPAILGAAIFVLMIISRVITETRDKSIGFISLLDFDGFNIFDFFHLFWEAGRVIRNVSWTMHFMDSDHYRFGSTYLESILVVIPFSKNFLQENLLTFERPSEWLISRVETLGPGIGLGYSQVAESFLNFGFFGAVLFLVLGYFVGYFYFNFIKNGRYDFYLISMSVALMLILHMRNDSAAFLRLILWEIIIIYAIRRYSIYKFKIKGMN